jgi:hypothetical protein
MSNSNTDSQVSLDTPLSLLDAWRFPIQSAASRRDLIIGGLWLLVPVIGWLMNMGHRVQVVHNMHAGRSPWPAWENPRSLLRHGCLTFAGMIWFCLPGVLVMALGLHLEKLVVTATGGALWAAAVMAIPGYMTHYCQRLDPREIFHPTRALSRVGQGGRQYWKAWLIVFPTMACSFLGLLVFGVGFLFTSVWFWQVAAFCFATVFTQRFQLSDSTAVTDPH